MTVTPITPQEVPDQKKAALPESVLTAWNELIAKAFTNGRAVVMQNDAITKLISVMGVSRQQVFAEKWLDVEEIYRKAGWTVVYDRPAYNESYEASFTFTPKSNA